MQKVAFFVAYSLNSNTYSGIAIVDEGILSMSLSLEKIGGKMKKLNRKEIKTCMYKVDF